jgi:hypothetical protein
MLKGAVQSGGWTLKVLSSRDVDVVGKADDPHP